MENLKTHIISVFVTLVFLFFALASGPSIDTNDSVSCQWSGLYDSDPITPAGDKLVNYQIKLLDKVTNLPIPGITVDVYLGVNNCNPLPACPERCQLSSSFTAYDNIGLTNANGIFSDNTTTWVPKDKNDILYLTIKIKDENTLKYAYKRLDKTIKATDTGLSITTYLLKDDLL
jgi:hypothetical protein